MRSLKCFPDVRVLVICDDSKELEADIAVIWADHLFGKSPQSAWADNQTAEGHA